MLSVIVGGEPLVSHGGDLADRDCPKMVDWLLRAFAEVGLQDVRGYDTPDGSVAVCGYALAE